MALLSNTYSNEEEKNGLLFLFPFSIFLLAFFQYEIVHRIQYWQDVERQHYADYESRPEAEQVGALAQAEELRGAVDCGRDCGCDQYPLVRPVLCADFPYEREDEEPEQHGKVNRHVARADRELVAYFVRINDGVLFCQLKLA